MTQRQKSVQPAVTLTRTLHSLLTVTDLLTVGLTLPAVVVQFVSAHTAAAPRQAVLALRTVVVTAAVILGAVSGYLSWTTNDTDDYSHMLKTVWQKLNQLINFLVVNVFWLFNSVFAVIWVRLTLIAVSALVSVVTAAGVALVLIHTGTVNTQVGVTLVSI